MEVSTLTLSQRSTLQKGEEFLSSIIREAVNNNHGIVEIKSVQKDLCHELHINTEENIDLATLKHELDTRYNMIQISSTIRKTNLQQQNFVILLSIKPEYTKSMYLFYLNTYTSILKNKCFNLLFFECLFFFLLSAFLFKQ